MQESDVQWLHGRLVKVRGPLARMSLTDRERRVLDCLHVRMWELALPVVRLTEREIAAWTGIRQPHVHNALSGLKGRWVVWSPAPSVVGIVLNDATWLDGEDRGEETVVIGKAKGKDSVWPPDTPQGIKDAVRLDTLLGINAQEGSDTPQGITGGEPDTPTSITADTPQGIADTPYSPTGDTNVSQGLNRIPSEYGAEAGEYSRWRFTLMESKNPPSVVVALIEQKLPRQMAEWKEKGVNPYSKVGQLVSRGRRRNPHGLPSWKEVLRQVWQALADEPDGDIVDYVQGKWNRERERKPPPVMGPQRLE